MKARSWKPARHGIMYCSPACGCGCTWKDYQDAVADADALAKRLGEGWKPDVWENGGWHYSVNLAGVSISKHSDGRYLLLTASHPQLVAEAKSLSEVKRKAMRQALSIIKKMELQYIALKGEA